MSHKHLLTIASMCIMIVVTGAHLCFGQFYWKKSYDGGKTYHLSDIQTTRDGNFLITGSDTKPGLGWDAYLLKIKPNGDTLWTKTYPFDGIHYGFSAVRLLNDNNLLMIGNTGSNSWFVNAKPDGDFIRTKSYDGIAEGNTARVILLFNL